MIMTSAEEMSSHARLSATATSGEGTTSNACRPTRTPLLGGTDPVTTVNKEPVADPLLRS